jgi:hypothetical protein
VSISTNEPPTAVALINGKHWEVLRKSNTKRKKKEFIRNQDAVERDCYWNFLVHFSSPFMCTVGGVIAEKVRRCRRM